MVFYLEYIITELSRTVITIILFQRLRYRRNIPHLNSYKHISSIVYCST